MRSHGNPRSIVQRNLRHFNAELARDLNAKGVPVTQAEVEAWEAWERIEARDWLNGACKMPRVIERKLELLKQAAEG